MEKRCIICGKPLDEGLTHCPRCGSGQRIAPEAPQPVEQEPAPPVKKTPPKILFFGAIALAVVLLLTAGHFVFCHTPQKALDDFCAVANGDPSPLPRMMPDAAWDYYANKFNFTLEETLAYASKEATRNSAEGWDIRVEYRIESETAADAATLQKLKEDLQSFGIDPDDVTAVRDLVVYNKVTCEELDLDEEHTRYIWAVKIDGRWYLAYDLGNKGAHFYYSFPL